MINPLLLTCLGTIAEIPGWKNGLFRSSAFMHISALSLAQLMGLFQLCSTLNFSYFCFKMVDILLLVKDVLFMALIKKRERILQISVIINYFCQAFDLDSRLFSELKLFTINCNIFFTLLFLRLVSLFFWLCNVCLYLLF